MEAKGDIGLKILWDKILNCATIGKIILSFFDFMK